MTEPAMNVADVPEGMWGARLNSETSIWLNETRQDIMERLPMTGRGVAWKINEGIVMHSSTR